MNPRWLYPALAAAAVALAALLPEFAVLVFCYIALYALVATGLVMLTGIGGMTSFGQAAFVGVGAYATAWVCTWGAAAWGIAPDSASLPWLGLACGLALTAAIAQVIGRVTAGLAGHYLPLGTIAWGISFYLVFGNVAALGGFSGITGLPAIAIGEASLHSSRRLAVLAWLVLLAVLWALANLLDSREGRAIRSVRAGRVMAESVGVDTTRQRVRLFVLAGIVACVSGWLYAHLQRFVSPAPFGLNMGIEYLFMTVVGGAGHLWGAVAGAAVVTLAKQQLQDLLPALVGAAGNFETIAFGLLMLLVLQRWPAGIAGWLARRFERRGSTAVESLPPPADLPSRRPLEPGSTVLRAEALTRRFGGLVANQGVSFDLKAGEIHALIGPNGAGKSTLFNLLSGVDDPTSGSVELIGRPMTGRSARAFAALGLARTFQHVHLLGECSALENVALGGYLRGHRGWIAAMLRRERAEEAALLADAAWQLKRCGVARTDALAATLPLGQQRLVEIARALAAHPHVLLLDEPAAGLRLQEKQALAQLLAGLREEGMAILIVEHDMEFLMPLADRVTVLNFGTVIAQGVPTEVQASPVVVEAYLGAEVG